jgi:hypothetical protein
VYYGLVDRDRYTQFLIDSKLNSNVMPVKVSKEKKEECNCHQCEYLRFNPEENKKVEEGEDPVYLQD